MRGRSVRRGLIGLLEQLVDGGDAFLDGDGGAAVFLNGAGAKGAGVSARVTRGSI